MGKYDFLYEQRRTGIFPSPGHSIYRSIPPLAKDTGKRNEHRTAGFD
jgi:hypothetical protein